MDVMNGKPSWDDAPVWANWLAQDFNGDWWWYEDKPINDGIIHGFWGGVGAGKKIEEATPLLSSNTADDWRSTLEPRPEGV